MTMVLERSAEAANAVDLHRELLAAGFVIELWGDGARMVLSPAPTPGLRQPFDRASTRTAEAKGAPLS